MLDATTVATLQVGDALFRGEYGPDPEPYVRIRRVGTVVAVGAETLRVRSAPQDDGEGEYTREAEVRWPRGDLFVTAKDAEKDLFLRIMREATAYMKALRAAARPENVTDERM